MKFIAVYAAACLFLNRSEARPDVSQYPEDKQKRLIADHDLETILEANNMIANNGKPWKANLADTNEWKYYPGFRVIPDHSAPAGFRLAFHGCGNADSYAFLGARHACKTEELARFMGNNCPELYKYTLS